jgi:hypothetical protein
MDVKCDKLAPKNPEVQNTQRLDAQGERNSVRIDARKAAFEPH